VGTLEWDTRPPAEIEDRISVRPLVPHVNLPFELARFDINLTPLERNAFCDAKSPLKFFESGLVDVPTIATRNPTYESIEAISNGCILADGPDTWREHILRLADETALRQHLGESARRTALENFDCDLAVGLYEELPSK
jgi:glycosyltransferase involved in cell wall biosynthesis